MSCGHYHGAFSHFRGPNRRKKQIPKCRIDLGLLFEGCVRCVQDQRRKQDFLKTIYLRIYQVSQKSVCLCTDLTSCKRTVFLDILYFMREAVLILTSMICKFDQTFISCLYLPWVFVIFYYLNRTLKKYWQKYKIFWINKSTYTLWSRQGYILPELYV